MSSSKNVTKALAKSSNNMVYYYSALLIAPSFVLVRATAKNIELFMDSVLTSAAGVRYNCEVRVGASLPSIADMFRRREHTFPVKIVGDVIF